MGMYDKGVKVIVNHLSGKNAKAAQAFRNHRGIAVELQRIARDLGIKSFTFRSVREDEAHFSTFEGSRQWRLRQNVDGEVEQLSCETVSQDSFGASGVNYEMFRPIPVRAGEWFVQVSYYSGFHMSVYAILPSEKPLPESVARLPEGK